MTDPFPVACLVVADAWQKKRSNRERVEHDRKNAGACAVGGGGTRQAPARLRLLSQQGGGVRRSGAVPQGRFRAGREGVPYCRSPAPPRTSAAAQGARHRRGGLRADGTT